jgi:hypothetical protein
MPNEALSSRAVSRTKWRTILQWIAVIVAVEIAFHIFVFKQPILTLGVALWLGGFFWTRRGAGGGPVLIAVLATWEILATLLLSGEFAEGADVAAWIPVVHFVSVVIALLAAVMSIRERAPSRAQALPS